MTARRSRVRGRWPATILTGFLVASALGPVESTPGVDAPMPVAAREPAPAEPATTGPTGARFAVGPLAGDRPASGTTTALPAVVTARALPAIPADPAVLADPAVVADPAVPAAATAFPVTLRAGCAVSGDVVTVADRLLKNRYKLGPRPAVVLPRNPTWRENPFHDRNWLFNYHALRFVLKLEAAWAKTGRQRYIDRAVFLLKDWLHDNPRSHPRSAAAWEHHATAWRAMVYACTAAIVPSSAWLQAALELHGRVLADERVYEDHGNHALNQAIGLLEVGCVLHRAGWLDLAARRINGLVVESVDAQGVTNEQAIGYE
ncbi:MAG TPA: heparinase II/III family protein, partial [Patescibacteria group bacterium]|nr:heparinase II/III family protein [Patescibacteria group bacterium]